MPGPRHIRYGLRGLWAVCLAVFLSFASVAPVALAAIASGDCCPTAKAHACCRKHHKPGGETAITPAPCGTECCRAAMAQRNGAIGAARPAVSVAAEVRAESSIRTTDCAVK